MTGTAVLKKSIRDCERLLRRPTLPADVRQEKERKLAALRHAAQQQLTANKQRDLQQRYKMVKFVEAKKAGRRLQQALKRGDAEAIKEARKDCLYIQFFPSDEKYVSLWPSEEMTDEQQLARRAELREHIFAEHADADIKLPGLNMAAKGGESASTGKKSTGDSDDEDSDDGDSDDYNSEDDDDFGSDDGADDDDDDGEMDSDDDSEVNDDDDDEEFDSDDDDESDYDSDEIDSDGEDDLNSDDDDMESDFSDEEDVEDNDDEDDEDDDEDNSDDSDDSDSDDDAPQSKKQRQ